MEKLRKQIRESFFNPILHFLPLIIFLVVDDFYGMSVAWKISFPVAFVLLFYVYFKYSRIFNWHLVFTLMFIIVSIIASLEIFFNVPYINHNIACELAILPFLLIFLLFRKKIKIIFQNIVSNLIPITNNFEELYKVILAFFLILISYVTAFLLFQFVVNDALPFQTMLQYLYFGVIIFFVVYEVLRVKIIRSKLLKEEWWPIVTSQGKIIGSTHHLTSLNDDKKYMHPIVRVLIIEKAMILMQKGSEDDFVNPGLWDTIITNHVKIGETIEQCVDRTAVTRYSLVDFKYMHLANYTLEVEKEKHYAFLFVGCQQAEIKINSIQKIQLKWWTQQQVEENLESGIFTDNFKIEFDLLRRSGLLETGKCACNCRLREIIYNQPSALKKENLN